MNTMLNTIEGSFKLQLITRCEASGISIDSVQIQADRRLDVSQLFQSRQIPEIQNLIPAVYGLCATAHSIASVEALEQTQGICVSEDLKQARQALIEMEVAREHLLHILLNWSKFLDQSLLHPVPTLFPELRRISRSLSNPPAESQVPQPLTDFVLVDWELQLDKLEQHLAEQVLGCPVPQWLAIKKYAELYNWLDSNPALAGQLLKQVIKADWSSLGQSDIPPLAGGETQCLQAVLDSCDAQMFLSRPVWQGECRESTCLGRCPQTELLAEMKPVFGNGILLRLVARLTELALLPGRIRQRIKQIKADNLIQPTIGGRWQDGIGESWVNAARGKLMHRMRLTDGMVASYQILTPTEWNFHPQGVVTQGLMGITARRETELLEIADLYISCIDPCMAYEVQLNHRVRPCA